MNTYEPFYGLRATPFRLTPDPGFFFASGTHKSAQGHLRYALHQGEGFVVVSGSPGTGKTVLMLSLLGELDPEKAVTAKIVSTNISADEILELVAHAFGVGTQGQSKGTWLKRLEEYFLDQARLGKRIVLFIDEAHHLSAGSISELALLANFQLDSLPVFQCFLLGQERLLDRLAEPRLRHVRQRVIASVTLAPLSPEDTRAYIEYRLSCAGWQGDPRITRGAHEVIYRFTGGNPRQINVFCNRLLLSSYLEHIHCVDQRVVAQAAEEVLQETVIAHAPIEALDLHGLATELRSESEQPPRQIPGGEPVRRPVADERESHKTKRAKPRQAARPSHSVHGDAPEVEPEPGTAPQFSTQPGDSTIEPDEANAEQTEATGGIWRWGAVAAVVVLALGSAVYVFDTAKLRDDAQTVAGKELSPDSGPTDPTQAVNREPAGGSQPPSSAVSAERTDQESEDLTPGSTQPAIAGNRPASAPTVPLDEHEVPQPGAALPSSQGVENDGKANARSAGAQSPVEEPALELVGAPPATMNAAAVNAELPAKADPEPAPAIAATYDTSISKIELHRLLNEYSDAYEAGDLTQLLGLFAEGVRSNGKSGRGSISQDYEKLFTLTDSRDITIANVTWRAGERHMHGRGSFRLSVREKTLSRVARYEGNIAFDVRSTERGPVITQLNFSYDN